MNDNTRDLSKFGYREKDLAAELLKALSNGQGDFLEDDIAVEFNPHSGNVFLVDADNNVGMMNGDKLEQWFYCHECGEEGFKEDFDESEHTFANGYIEHTQGEEA